MKCPNCGAENPDYAFYCGKCAAQLMRTLTPDSGTGSSHAGRPETMIESILRRNLVRMSENVAKKQQHGLLRRLGAGSFWRSGTIVFKSEFEEVSLCFDEEGHTLVNGGVPTKAVILLEGPHDSFLTMFRDEHHFEGVPESIEVHVDGIGSSNGSMAQQVMRGGVNSLLRILLK